VLGDLGLSKSTGAPDESDLRELIRDVSRQDFRAPPRAMVLLEHDAEETRFVSELACHLILEGLGVGFADFPDIELGDLMSAMLVERLRATGWLLNYEPGAAGIGAKMRVRQHGVRRFLVVLATPNYVDDVLALETWGKSQIRAAGTSDEFRAGIRNRVVVYAQDGVDVFRYDILKQSFGVTGERVIQAQARNAEHAAQQIDAALSELPSWSS
jgi:hypothetical protein